ncbi:MAG TPA: efflux RND transporter periplasmic adaptor subunit [Telluria sp.]
MLTLLCWPLLLGAAPAPEQLRISVTEIARAGVAVAPALGTLDAAAPNSNDQYLAGTVVAPAASVTLASSELGGVVQEIHVSTLQQVRAGTPLLTMFSQPWMALQRDYLELASHARLAADKLARDESLFADGIIARSRVEESRAAAQLAALAAAERYQALRRAGLDAAAIKALLVSRKLSPSLTVRAQYAGTVLDLPVSPGQQVDAGMPLAKVGRDGPLWVELQASRQQLPMLKIGDVLQVAGCSKLKVIAISPLLNGANQSAQLRAQQLGQDPCLKINAFVEARLLRPTLQGGSVAVPEAALVQRGSDKFVFLRNRTGFAVVPVQARAAGGGMVWISGPVAVGDAVATKGIVALKGVWAGLGSAPAAATKEGQ